MYFQVILTADEDGEGFTVECPALSGCISQGDTREEALANIQEAISLCCKDPGRGRPDMAMVEVPDADE